MAKQPEGEVASVIVGFNYDLLKAKVAEKVRSSADRIRERMDKTVENIIEIGNNLLAAKEALEHGQFGPWLKAEFGWCERMARNCMAVAEQFGKSTFCRTTHQAQRRLLASCPLGPRRVAVEKAQAGEEITFAAAKETVA
jgi:hypothetical protein